jgi:uncharacterized protein
MISETYSCTKKVPGGIKHLAGRLREMTMFRTKLRVVVLMFPSTGWVHAASFDCSSAKTKVERLICDHADLSRLDDQRGSAFQTTLNEAADQTSLAQTQRKWIKTRNRCADFTFLTQTYSDRLVTLRGVKRAEWETYNDPDVGISFEYLGNRQIKKSCPQLPAECCAALIGRNMGIRDYIIAFKVVTGTLEMVAENEGGFGLENDKWITTGGGTSEDVDAFDGSGWKGMRNQSVWSLQPGVWPTYGFLLHRRHQQWLAFGRRGHGTINWR